MNNKKGFTLIELIVVVVIIGLLAAMILAGLNYIRIRGRNAARQKDMNAVKIALEQYFDQVGNYPTTGVPTCPGYTATGFTNAVGALVPTYLTKVPTDPRSPTYNYQYCGDANKYELWWANEPVFGGTAVYEKY